MVLDNEAWDRSIQTASFTQERKHLPDRQRRALRRVAALRIRWEMHHTFEEEVQIQVENTLHERSILPECRTEPTSARATVGRRGVSRVRAQGHAVHRESGLARRSGGGSTRAVRKGGTRGSEGVIYRTMGSNRRRTVDAEADLLDDCVAGRLHRQTRWRDRLDGARRGAVSVPHPADTGDWCASLRTAALRNDGLLGDR